MSHLWDNPSVPCKGWACVIAYDVEEGCLTSKKRDYETCEMCGAERIRYVHVMAHENYANSLAVGRICAGRMSDDAVGAKDRERILRIRAKRQITRRSLWLKRQRKKFTKRYLWKKFAKGALHIQINNQVLDVFERPNGRWSYRIDSNFSRDSYACEIEATLALFNKYFPISDSNR